MSSCWHHFCEWLLPSGTFNHSDKPQRHLVTARVIIFIFYVGLTGVTLSVLSSLLFSGQRKVDTEGYKVDTVEAPSVAICPFNPGGRIVKPSAGPYVSVRKYSVKGSAVKNVSPVECTFDRVCMCVDMSAYVLRDAELYYQQHSPLHSGFQERFELNTTLRDDSGSTVLKFGLYDSVDASPEWFYINQGAILYGQVQLEKWTLMRSFTLAGMQGFLHGKVNALQDKRHFYHCNGQELHVGGAKNSSITSVAYEMRNFFIADTTVSERAFSWFTLINLIMLLVGRTAIISIFIDSVFPLYDPSAGPKQRVLSPQAVMMEEFARAWCSIGCCCICWPCWLGFGRDGEESLKVADGEKQESYGGTDGPTMA